MYTLIFRVEMDVDEENDDIWWKNVEVWMDGKEVTDKETKERLAKKFLHNSEASITY